MKNILKKIPLAVSIILLLALGFIFFYIYKQINLNAKETEATLIELENEISDRNELRLLNNSARTIKDENTILSSHFAKSSDIVPFLDTIEGIARIVGVKAETTNVDISEGNAGLIVRINTTGNFKDIYRFLTLLENSPYELEFLNMDIEKESTPVAGEGVKVDLSTKWNASFKIKLLSFVQ